MRDSALPGKVARFVDNIRRALGSAVALELEAALNGGRMGVDRDVARPMLIADELEVRYKV